jgi:hypothetical protein
MRRSCGLRLPKQRPAAVAVRHPLANGLTRAHVTFVESRAILPAIAWPGRRQLTLRNRAQPRTASLSLSQTGNISRAGHATAAVRWATWPMSVLRCANPVAMRSRPGNRLVNHSATIIRSAHITRLSAAPSSRISRETPTRLRSRPIRPLTRWTRPRCVPGNRSPNHPLMRSCLIYVSGPWLTRAMIILAPYARQPVAPLHARPPVLATVPHRPYIRV